MEKIAIIIPSRLSAERLPNKPLKLINNKEMILHVYDIAKSSNVGEVIVATPDKEILAMGNLAHGEKVFKKCSACHLVAKGGKNKIGPALYGIVGKDSAVSEGYSYSKAMKAHGKSWSFEELNAYLLKPQSYIKGTKMAFAGLRKDKDRASVILYLNSQSDSPLPKP